MLHVLRNLAHDLRINYNTHYGSKKHVTPAVYKCKYFGIIVSETNFGNLPAVIRMEL